MQNTKPSPAAYAAFSQALDHRIDALAQIVERTLEKNRLKPKAPRRPVAKTA
jgi:hypothetical protein